MDKKKTILRWSVVGAVLALLLALLVVLPGVREGKQNETEPSPSETAEQTTAAPTEAAETESSEAETQETETDAPETEPVMLAELAEWYEENPDMGGWLTVENTRIDGPVMYTPEEEEKYIYADFDGSFKIAGSFFIDADCSMDPESDNIIIYGHNMKDGTMFGSLKSYQYESYWKEHPIIVFSTLYEKREYEVVSAFYDRVYYKDEDCFKFYQFVDADDEQHFNETMAQFKAKAMYDTGVTAEYGDHLITLVTCSFHVDNGRFVVVARAKGEQAAE